MRTRESYDEVASEYLEATRSRGLEERWLRSFADALPAGARILDLGSGPGRDSLDLRGLGLEPICVDLSIGMLRAGLEEYPGPRIQADFTALPLRDGVVAGIWANACLLHLPADEMPEALAEIRRASTPGGRLHLTLKKGRAARWESKRYGRPRWFQYWEPDALDACLVAAGFTIEASAEEQASSNVWLVRQCRAAS